MVSVPAKLPAKIPTLLPGRDHVTAAAGNVAHKLLYGGIADLRPMPRTLIDEGVLREVYHYRPLAGTTQQGDPVLLVMPLAAPSTCYDLRRGCSLVEHLVQGGRPTYLVEYGEIAFANRNLGMEHWVEVVLPAAIRAVSRHAGDRPVHVVAWSLGGIFSLLTAGAFPDLPIETLTIFGSPIDVSQVPLIAPLRPLVDLTNGRILGTAVHLLGGAPKPLVKWAFQLSAVQKILTKPYAQLTHLADTDFLAQVEAVDRFSENMIAYPGRTFGQLYHRFVRRNELVEGSWDLEGRHIDLADITAPTLVFAGATDGIAPVPSVRVLVDLLSGAEEVEFHTVPGGHLGMLTGRAARTSSWPILDEWMRRHDGRGAVDGPLDATPAQAAGGTTGSAPGSDAPATKATRKRTAPRRGGSRSSQGAIGANPKRRYSSQSSRALGRPRSSGPSGTPE